MIKVGICDGEKVIREYILETLKKEGPECIYGVYASAEEVLEKKEFEDIWILDIDFPGISGMELANWLCKERKIIIFLTSHEEVMSEAFKVGAYQFLHKPVKKIELLQTVADAVHEIVEDVTLVVKEKGAAFRIRIREILFFEAAGDGTYIHTHEKIYFVRESLKYWEERVVMEGFVRTHKSYIVSLAYLSGIAKKEVMVEARKIPVSRRRHSQVKQEFYEYLEKNARCL